MADSDPKRNDAVVDLAAVAQRRFEHLTEVDVLRYGAYKVSGAAVERARRIEAVAGTGSLYRALLQRYGNSHEDVLGWLIFRQVLASDSHRGV